MSKTLPFDLAGRIPAPGDNVAIASQRLDAGTVIDFHGTPLTIKQTVLEGHRFVIQPIAAGERLLSWGLPFGTALTQMLPGDYACNEMMLTALKGRRLDFSLPAAPNFKDHFEPYHLDEANFRPGKQVAPVAHPRTFQGYARPGSRGVGTRNFIILLGTSSRTASFVRALEAKLKPALKDFTNIDGIVAVAHTEGGGEHRPNNYDLTLRTLAGFLVHCNVAAVLAVDTGTEPVNNQALQAYAAERGYPLKDVLHQFHTLSGSIESELEHCAKIVRGWLPAAQQMQRTPQPLKHLRISLQCGGSDAFSGVSGNPLAGWIVKETIRHGGSGNLAETDELVGAEPYILANVRDLETARTFLDKIDRFEERVRWHGASSQTNPSGGNLYRGLYNIAIKSIGAGRKKDPELRLDYIIDYAQPMTEPGFYFMDSPGNDLESVAGQMACGCNLILFVTGNGSITNFPFVPTIKLMTNSGRFRLLSHEMDINAGRYIDGEPFEALGAEAFDQTIRVASGELTAGERAGHAQVQLWREWQQTAAPSTPTYELTPLFSGQPIALAASAEQDSALASLPTKFEPTPVHLVRLIQPTSLCAGQVGRLIADKLNNDTELTGKDKPRFVALPHTEGCGVSGEAIDVLERTMSGYLQHPSVSQALLLEHGCEKTHNDTMRNYLRSAGADLNRFGWASIQLDGGIEAVTQRVREWFKQQQATITQGTHGGSNLSQLRIGLGGVGVVPKAIAEAFALLVRHVVKHGGTVVIASDASLWKNPAFTEALHAEGALNTTLAYAQKFQQHGLHIMDCPADHWVETITGLGATGVDVVLAFTADRVLQGHPLLPVMQITDNVTLNAGDIDLALPEISSTTATASIFGVLLDIASGRKTAAATMKQNIDFQVSRGRFGVST